MIPIRLEVGKSYVNGWGAVRKIVSAPTAECQWFKDHDEFTYHEDGSMVVIRVFHRHFNLKREAL